MARRRRSFLISGGALLVLAVVPGQAAGGVYTVANCASDPSRYATDAFSIFATRGMRIVKACTPEGERPRGLIVGNTVRPGGTVKRGAVAQISLAAPPGTHFVDYRWAGEPKRSDCRYAIQAWADAPGMKPIPILNVRANQRCPRRGRAQAAQVPEKRYSVAGA